MLWWDRDCTLRRRNYFCINLTSFPFLRGKRRKDDPAAVKWNGCGRDEATRALQDMEWRKKNCTVAS